MTSGGLGTMGFGLPTAIGAALVFPEKDRLYFGRRIDFNEYSGIRYS
ncbi:acetolactate synthase catalytic subunit family protein [Leptospira interrogans serovar Pyrogenes str. 200701872]|uniref:Acetolactate synthase catalytic subunit family protein n=1 Tax=Leptospira interrogans serovar Pyrogenes str. 200701872 TaxID=1193029 RepID=M6ZXP3_LEPIR|nr:acetolactate synthase catalytic subunit family protein [Leptospira interrogans serovar Pyrogenes str. 200701872]